jgi:hypothetical protein
MAGLFFCTQDTVLIQLTCPELNNWKSEGLSNSMFKDTKLQFRHTFARLENLIVKLYHPNLIQKPAYG